LLTPFPFFPYYGARLIDLNPIDRLKDVNSCLHRFAGLPRKINLKLVSRDRQTITAHQFHRTTVLYKDIDIHKIAHLKNEEALYRQYIFLFNTVVNLQGGAK